MTELWCKLWNFLLNTFNSIIDGIGIALGTVGTVLVDVLGTVAGAVGDVLGIPGGLFLWIGLGFGAYLIVKAQDKKTIQVNPAAKGVT